MSFELLVILFLIALSGIFAMTEIALVSVRKSRLEQRIQEGDRRAEVALELANSPQMFLSTVQCGMTLIGTFAGAFGGATLSEDLKFLFDAIPWIGQYSEILSFGVVVCAITYITIVVGELVPKTVALNHAESIALFMARPMRAFLKMTYPFVSLLSSSTNLVLKLLRVGKSSEPEVTQDEIEIMIEQGAESGVLEETEQEMVERVFRLGDRLISLLMTPRKDVVWIDYNDPIDVNIEKMATSNHSHFPLCDKTPDKVLGMINIKDIVLHLKKGTLKDLKTILTPALFIPDNLPSLRVLNQFKENKTHIAVVLDEYGSFEGLVTLNDFMEAITGEMSQNPGTEEPAIVTRSDGSWLVDAQLVNDELKELLSVNTLHEEEQGNYQTLAGMLLSLLGRIPSIGDTTEWGGYRFEIVDMDRNRIDRVLITRLEKKLDEDSLENIPEENIN